MKVVVNKMIGVITKENVYPLLIEIVNKCNTNIYLYKNDNIELGIEKLKEKNCQIIITDLDYSNINEQNIKFISIKYPSTNNDYLIDNKELIDAVNEGNESRVAEILDNINIPNDKDILIINPIILLVLHLIKNKFPNNIKTISDIIIESINIEDEIEGQIYLIN